MHRNAREVTMHLSGVIMFDDSLFCLYKEGGTHNADFSAQYSQKGAKAPFFFLRSCKEGSTRNAN